ncbi:MAG: amidohydrolase family protein [Lachnospiraceae bacterium]|nr:amidohydrolase family protein [Lachnospiraceae bacterium]
MEGKERVSLWIRNARVYNSFLKKFERANVAVRGERFYYIDRRQEIDFEAEEIVDVMGRYMLPGLTDIHMHIESSMMTPSAIAGCLAENGVTTVVTEPHEMANVKGLRGVEEMIRSGADTPVDIYYGIPASVPTIGDGMETTGGRIDFADMRRLLARPEVVCVGEVMNYRQIIQEKDLEITKFLRYLRENGIDIPVEGHCPSLVDLELAKYLYQGIDSDHTEHTFEEACQRLENGMFLEIQDKMLDEKLLQYIRKNGLYEYCAFVTDDTMADTLIREGHLNRIVEKAMEKGFPPEKAIYCATYTPARRMRLFDHGCVSPGKLADFMIVAEPVRLRPEMVYKRGRQIYRKGDSRQQKKGKFPKDFYKSVVVSEAQLAAFDGIHAPIQSGEVTVRAIEVSPHSTHTRGCHIRMPVKDGLLRWEESGCLLAAVIERHGKNGAVGIGFLTGACHKKGTVATTYCHDHHNLLVAGDNVEDMKLAVRRLFELQGGYLTVQDGKILAELALPVGGIVSECPAEEIGGNLSQVRQSMEKLGYEHENPIMSFSCLGLPVSPEWKLTDQGLINVKRGQRVSLFVS